jgi:subtilisin-like proprotein convertase family protein
MKTVYLQRVKFILLIIFLNSFNALSQSEIWKDLNSKIDLKRSERSSMPSTYRSLSLNLPALKSKIYTAINENDLNAFLNGPRISLPLPDGSFEEFSIAVSELMPKALSDKFPMIHTYSAKGINDPTAYAKIDITELGFHAMIISSHGWYFIDPAFIGNTNLYISYDRKNSVATNVFICETENTIIREGKNLNNHSVERSAGTQLKTYRLAVACTGEYAAFFGGTQSAALSAIITSVNRVNGVYELELAVRLVLIANNNLLVYTNASTDPYTNGDGGTMLGENQSTITSVIGSANYDIGHVFGIGSGGVAGLGVVCSSSQKARGVTGNASPVGDNFDIDYVAHEMGHQFGGNHTFNSVTGNCSGNRASSAAYEPGSGTTIMAYAGICDADDIQPHSDAIFHSKSFDEIQTYITSPQTGGTCPIVTSTGNTPPVVTVGANYTIPLNTPFILTGSATDVNNDALTYLWEEYDLGTAGAPNSPSGNAPIFRDFTPVTNNYRVFPRMEDLVNNTQTLGELLPTYARSLAFRLMVRDNRAGGAGVTHNDTPVTLTVANTTTPFKVTIPNTALTWFANSTQTVTWDVSSTNISPINCANVNILLSVDNGFTYPFTLLSNTPNDGSQSVTIPNVTSTTARIKVESVGNIFFDISNVNFTINISNPVITVISTQALSSSVFCAGAIVNVDFTTDGPANAGNVFTAQLSNSSGSFASPVAIGTLTSINSGTINATIPAGTVTGTGYRIRVVSSNPAVTGSNNGTNLSIYQTPGTPGNISGATTACQGQTGVVYSVPAIANATGYLWNFTPAATITSGANSNTVTVTFSTSAVSGTVTVTGTNAGCSNGPTSSPASITINQLPGAAGIITGTSSACQSQQNVAYSVAAITGATGYNWILPSGASIVSGSNTNSVNINFSAAATSGNISVSGINTCGSGTSSSFAVNVNPVPVQPNISTSGSVSICSPGSVTLSFTPVAGATYQWRKNNVNIPGQTGSNYVASTAGNYDVVAKLLPNTTQTLTNSSPVSIPDNICPGAMSSIIVSGYNGTVNSSGISLKLNITHTYVGDLVLMLETPDGHRLGLSNQTGNSSNSGDNFTNTIFSDAGTTVIPTTGAPYTGTYKPVAATFTNCSTTTITTFAAIGSGTLNPNGTWKLLAIDVAGQDLGTIQNWSLNLPAGNPNPCSIQSNVINVTVNSTVTPTVSIVSDPGNTICAGSSVSFTATAVNGGSTPIYQWKNDGVNVGTNDPVYTTSALANDDVITCEMISNATCVSINPAVSNQIAMTVIPLPVINTLTPSTGISGTQVSINGSGLSNASSVSFNGSPASFTVNNDNLISTSVPGGATNGFVTVVNTCGSVNSPYTFTVDVGDSVTLDLKILIEGYYRGNGQMIGTISPSICDTIFVGIADMNVPHSIIYSVSGPISITGNGSFRFSGDVLGNSYYIVVKHRNSIEVWSKVPFLFSLPVNEFDFSRN